ncbi:MAG: hypothetical protein AAGJ74_00855 [Pseudomonadota bacterium]
MGFLETYGTEKAERCLAEFVSCVRKGGARQLSANSSTLVMEELATLQIRIATGRDELDFIRSATLERGALLQRACSVAETVLKEENPHGFLDDELAGLVDALAQAIPAHNSDLAGLSRADAWMDDLEAAVKDLMRQLAAAPEFSDTVRTGLVRVLSEISAALDTMTEAARASRTSAVVQRRAASEWAERLIEDPILAAVGTSVEETDARPPSARLRWINARLRTLSRNSAPRTGPEDKLH